MADFTVKALLLADSKGFVSGVSQADGALKELAVSSKAASSASGKAAQEQTAHMRGLGRVSAETASKIGKAGAVAGVAVAALALKSTKAASDLSESTAKIGVVFGKASDSVMRWSEGSAKAFGLSQQKALEAAGTYGNLFTAFGVGAGKSQKMSTSLVQLAADLASFNNTSIEDALTAIQSGLSGEMEPMKKYGAILSDVRLKQQAFDMGLISSVKDALTPAVKAQASYALMLRDTSTAQGDFTRTAGGLANQQRIMSAQWEDAQAKLGEALLPSMTSAAEAANSLLGAFNGLSPSTRTTMLVVAAFGAAAMMIVPKVVAVANGVRLWRLASAASAAATAADTAAITANTAAKQANAAASGGVGGKAAAVGKAGVGGGAAVPIAAVAAVVAAGVASFAKYRTEANATAGDVESLGQAFAQSGGLIDDHVRSTVAASVAEGDFASEAKRAGVSQAELVAAITQGGAAMDGVRSKLDAVKNSQVIAAGGGGGQAFFNGTAAGASVAMSKLEDLRRAFGDAQTSSDGFKAAQANLNAAMGQARAGFAGQSVHALAYARNLVEAGRAAGKTDVEIRSMLATLGATPKMVNVALSASPGRLHRELAEAQTRLNGLRQYRRPDIAAEIGPLQQRLAAAQQKVNSLRQDRKPNIDAIDRATRKVNDIVTAIGRVQDKTVTVTVLRAGKGLTPGAGLYTGGRVSGPGTGTSDSIPAWLSNGEFVVRASQAAKHERLLHAINSGFGYAAGGLVGRKKPQAAGGAGKKSKEAHKQLMEAQKSARGSLKESLADILFGLPGWREATAGQQVLDRGTALARQLNAGGRSGHAKTVALHSQTLAAQADDREAKVKRLTDAQQKLTAAQQAYDQAVSARSQASQQIAGAASGGFADAKSGQSARSWAARRLRTVRQFAANLRTLAARGLPQTLLSEIIQRGVDAAPLAASLVAMNAGDFSDVVSTGHQLAAESAALGDLGAGLQHDQAVAGAAVGVALAQGVADGLASEVATVESAMLATTDAIKGTVQSALGIRSPSTVMREMGRQTGRGLMLGLDDSTAGVASSAAGLLAPIASPASSSWAAGQGGGNTYSITVNAGLGADGVEVGRQVVEAISRFERGSGKVFVRA